MMLSWLEYDSSIVRTFAMRALADIATQDASYIGRVRTRVVRLMQQGSAAMKSRGRKLLAILDRE
jgi:hypothetical protein